MKKREPIQIIVDGCIYDEVNKISDVFGSIFMMSLDFYHIMSIEAIKQHMTAAIELVKEINPKSATSKIVKTMTRAIDKIKEKESLLKIITNLILAKEGLGLLPGFGLAVAESCGGRTKIKSRFLINPEKQSIY